MKATCAYCGNKFEIHTGHFNRANKVGLNVYCCKKHSTLGRRSSETKEEKKAVKMWYDMLLRVSMTEDDRMLHSLQNAVYFNIDYANNPEKYKEIRRIKMPKHVEYCRQPAYKKRKKKYDEQYRAKINYGSFWEAAVVLKELENVIDAREAKKENKLFNKSTSKRKRLWQKMLKTNLRQLT